MLQLSHMSYLHFHFLHDPFDALFYCFLLFHAQQKVGQDSKVKNITSAIDIIVIWHLPESNSMFNQESVSAHK